MTKIVRVDVDTQNGFCDPKGGLYVKGAERVTPLVSFLNREAQEKGYILIGSVDAHTPKDKEFIPQGGTWPVHCVKGTWDGLKVAETLPSDFRFIPMNGSIPTEALDGSIPLYFEKTAYSILDNWTAEAFIAQLMNKNIGATFEVYGVATDYCVKAAALGIQKMLKNHAYLEFGAKVRVLLSACAGVDPATTKAAIEEMREAGVEIVP